LSNPPFSPPLHFGERDWMIENMATMEIDLMEYFHDSVSESLDNE